jgi:hypothetical protein
MDRYSADQSSVDIDIVSTDGLLAEHLTTQLANEMDADGLDNKPALVIMQGPISRARARQLNQ